MRYDFLKKRVYQVFNRSCILWMFCGLGFNRLLRLLDNRYRGIAHGVGQSEILGRIHVAPIKVISH